MAWTLAGVTIHPGDKGDSGGRSASYAIQQVLGATEETKTWYASGSKRRTIKFWLLEDENGNTGLSTIDTAVTNDANVTLVSDLGSATVRILDYHYERLIDTNHTNPSYDVTANLIYST